MQQMQQAQQELQDQTTQCGECRRPLNTSTFSRGGFPDDASGVWYCHHCWTEYFRLGIEARLRDLVLRRCPVPSCAFATIAAFLNSFTWTEED